MPYVLQRLAWGPLRFFFVVFCDLRVKGLENITNSKGPMIIASNHVSELDPLLIVAGFPFFSKQLPLYFVSREREFYQKRKVALFYGGTFFRMMGAYRAYVGLKDYERALRHHIEIIEKGHNVCIFPTGRRCPVNEEVQARGGVSFLAQRTCAPILPVLIQGAEKITWPEFFGGKRKITVTFGNPLYAQDILQGTDKALANNGQNEYKIASEILMKKISQLA